MLIYNRREIKPKSMASKMWLLDFLWSPKKKKSGMSNLIYQSTAAFHEFLHLGTIPISLMLQFYSAEEQLLQP